MASAILARRNETHWGEQKVYMRKNPNSNQTNWKCNPNPNPNPNKKKCSSPRKQIYDRTSQIHGGGSAAAAAVKSDDSSSLTMNRKFRKESSHGGLLSFNISACSREELRGLKKRLMAELETVRRLASKIESRESQFQFQSRSGYSATQISGGGREVTSSTPRPQNCSPDPSGSRGSKGSKQTTKKVLGSKRSNQELECGGGGGRDPKRLASDPVNAKAVSAMMKKCGVVLSKLMKHKHGWIFNVPVDVVGMGLHDYNQIIKHPMDLGTVKSKLGNNLYQSPSDFASDVRLTFNNALRYNPKGHDVNAAAEQLLARFGELFEPEHRRYESERQVAAAEEMEPRRSSWNHQSPPPSIVPKSSAAARASTERTAPAPAPAPAPDPVPAPAPLAPVAPPSAAAKQLGVRSGKPPPKPKAKDPNKREMTFEEKQKLSLSLQSLPQEKMDQVLQIISKRDSKLAQHGDEIEVDIECIDKETLWELDRFVGYYKKMASKMKRQALAAAGQNSTATEESKFTTTVDETPEEEGTTGDAAAKKSKKGEAGGVEEEVDIGEEMPASNFPPVEIEKDAAGQASRSSSSSSSSSDDDDDNSSSSDSDSGSSSGSDSDDDEDEAQSPKKTSPGGG